MGHTKLRSIPKSKKWKVVVSEVVGEEGATETALLIDDVQHIASKTLEAAHGWTKYHFFTLMKNRSRIDHQYDRTANVVILLQSGEKVT